MHALALVAVVDVADGVVGVGVVAAAVDAVVVVVGPIDTVVLGIGLVVVGRGTFALALAHVLLRFVAASAASCGRRRRHRQAPHSHFSPQLTRALELRQDYGSVAVGRASACSQQHLTYWQCWDC